MRPLRIFTPNAFENAIASVAATGGSTNAVLHLLAMAREAEVALDIDDFETVSARTPILADLKPSGRFMAADVHTAGGIRLLASRLLGLGLLHGDAITVSGKTIAEEAATAQETPGQEVIVPADKPLKKSGGLVILHGNLAPEGCVAKISGHESLSHTGPARVFESEEDAMQAVTAKSIHRGDVVVIRYEGPRGGPGMREMLGVTARHRRRRPRRQRRSDHRRPLQRRNPRPHARPRSAGSRARRPHRRHPRWRPISIDITTRTIAHRCRYCSAPAGPAAEASPSRPRLRSGVYV